MPNLSKEEILMKFNSLGVKLINAKYIDISLNKNNIDNGKSIKIITIENIDFKLINIKEYIISNKTVHVSKEIADFFELPCGILTFNRYVDIEKLYSISSDVEKMNISFYRLIHKALFTFSKN